LLDTQLLAEVWLAMTRGQDALLIDVDDGDSAGGNGLVLARFDASGLPVLKASDEDLAEHEAYLAALDKSVGGECVWRKMEAPAAAV
jgi:DNA polymerase-3 subunit epsilon